MWNDLPAKTKQASSLDVFLKKTYLVNQVFFVIVK